MTDTDIDKENIKEFRKRVFDIDKRNVELDLEGQHEELNITKKKYEDTMHSIYNTIVKEKRFTQDLINDASKCIIEQFKIITLKETDVIYRYEWNDGIYVPDGEILIKTELEKYFHHKCTTAAVNEILNKARRLTYKPLSLFTDNNKKLLCLKNGVWSLMERKLYPHNPTYYFINRIPVNYHPTARCDKITKFLYSIVKEEYVPTMFEIVGFCMMPEYKIQKAVLLIGSGRNGKCYNLGVTTLMADGSWKKVEDIIVGDEVISPTLNGTFTYAKVINTHSRWETDRYNVVSNRTGEVLYGCAGNHDIPVYRQWTKRTSKDDSTPRIRERKYFEYEARTLATMYTKKSDISTFSTPSVEVKNPKELDIDPYCLGVYLGDGSKHNTAITTHHDTIINHFEKNFPEEIINIQNRQKDGEASLCMTYIFSKKGKLTQKLKEHSLSGKGAHDKFIPGRFLNTTINYRLELLAGLIDTDGYISKQGQITYCTASKQLAEDIKNLVYSLGGKSLIRKIIKKCQNDFEGEYYDLSIEFEHKTIIPLKTWKKDRLKDSRDPRPIGISVIPTDPGMVYGFEIDSPSKLLIVNNWVVGHNSVYLNMLKTFLGKENVSNQSIQRLSKDKFSSFNLFGKIANIFPDLSSEEIEDTSTFKTLTSGLDSIAAEQKFKDQFSFINNAKLLFSCNQIPKVRDASDAFFRRWIILTFPYIFEGVADNKELIGELTTDEELSGLLNIAIEYYHKLELDGEFSTHQSVDEIREIYTRLSDPVGSFILDKVMITADEFIPKDEVYNVFIAYCRDHKFPAMSEKMFSAVIFSKLPVTNFRASIERNGRMDRPMCWRGIGWKALEEGEEVHNESV